MKKLIPLITLFLQVLITCIVLSLIYIVYALADFDYNGITSGISFLIFQPLLGVFLISTTVVICLITGLPIRLNARVNQWWYTMQTIPLLGIVIGLMLLLLAFYPSWTEIKQVIIDGIVHQKQIPNSTMALLGWFMTAFFLLHFYPQSAMNFLKRKLKLPTQTLLFI